MSTFWKPIRDRLKMIPYSLLAVFDAPLNLVVGYLFLEFKVMAVCRSRILP